MALTYLELTNDVLTRMNEVVLTAGNFTSARGVQVQSKNAINEAIRHINQKEFAYPFNHSTNTSTLVPGVVRYTIPTGTKYIDYNTARIKKNTDLSASGVNLKRLNYNEYISKEFATQEDEVESTTLNGTHTDSVTTLTLVSTTGFAASGSVYIASELISYTAISGNTLTGCTRGAEGTTAAAYASGVVVTQFDNGGVPQYIVRTLDNNYLLYPYPDKEYTLLYDFFTFPDDLTAHGDTTSIPNRFKPVITDGAAAFLYQYRGEMQQYQINFDRFEDGIKNIQSLLVNKFDYIRSTVINRPTSSNSGVSMQSSLEEQGVHTRVVSAIPMDQVCEPYIRRRAVRHLEKKRVVIFAAGTGNPYFTTDTAATLRASEMACEAIFKGTQVDGIYNKDPKKHADAMRYDTVSYDEVLQKRLKVMDASAIALARDNNLPIIVFSLDEAGGFKGILSGQGTYTKVHG